MLYLLCLPKTRARKFHQKLTHRDYNLFQMRFKCEVAGGQKFDGCVRDVPRLRRSKILLEPWVQLHVVGIVKE